MLVGITVVEDYFKNVRVNTTVTYIFKQLVKITTKIN